MQSRCRYQPNKVYTMHDVDSEARVRSILLEAGGLVAHLAFLELSAVLLGYEGCHSNRKDVVIDKVNPGLVNTTARATS